MMYWSDMIFCMEDKHKEILKKRFPVATRDLRIIVLHIDDEYQYMDPELIDELELSTSAYF